MKNIFILALFAFSVTSFLPACNSKNDKKTGDDKKADSVVTNTTVTIKGVKLVCKDLMVPDTVGGPAFDVFLSVDGVQTKIKSILNCEEIPRANYADHEIPNDAISACGGWYAGAGEYFYVILKDGKPVVFEVWRDEQQEDKGYHWKETTLK